MEEKIQVSEFVTIDGEKIEQAEGSGKNGIYFWDVPADKLAEGKIRLSIPDVGIEQTIAFSAPPSIGECFRLSDVTHQ